MIGKFVKGSTMAISLLNQRVFTIILFLVGMAAAAWLIPQIFTESVRKRDVLGVILMVFLPYLIVKGVILLMLLTLDISINFSAKHSFTYRLNYERAKARASKLFIDRSVGFTKLDNFEFGIERYLVTVMQRYLTGTKFNYPTNFISMRPFVVARIYDLKDGRVQVKVLHEEEKEAEVVGRLLIATLEALEKEETARANLPQERAADLKSIEAVHIEIPQRAPPQEKPAGIIDRLKTKRRKK